ncbi:hypothetical protein Tco_0079603 [Tanacetum coccineum]
MLPKRTSTSEVPAMTEAAIRKLVADSVTAALEAQAATMANANNTNRNTGERETPVASRAILGGILWAYTNWIAKKLFKISRGLNRQEAVLIKRLLATLCRALYGVDSENMMEVSSRDSP